MANGNLWFTESGANKIGMISPTTHAVTDFAIPSTTNDQAEGITFGSDGNLWFTEQAGNAIGKMSPNTDSFSIYSTGLTASSNPMEITSGPDGNLWFTEQSSGNTGTISPSTGAIKEYSSYFNYQINPIGITTGADNNLYFAESGSNSRGLGKITTTGNETSVSIPSSTTAAPSSIVQGSDGNLWFVANTQYDSGGEVGVITPGKNDTIEYPFLTTTTTAEQIALDPNNNTLWFTEGGTYSFNSDKIGTINPTTRTVNEFTLSGGVRLGLQGITFDQSAFYYAEQTGNSIGTVNPSTNAIATSIVTLPSGSDPYGIVADSSGNLWFTEYGTGMVGMFNPITGNGSVTQIALAANSQPEGITVGPDGNLWVVETGDNNVSPAVPAKIAEINSKTLKVTETPAPATGSIASGSDGALWFTEANGFGRITTSTLTESSVPLPISIPAAITPGTDGNLWFGADSTGYPNYYPNVIGTIDIASAATATKVAFTTQPPSVVTATKGFGLIATVENTSGTADTYFNGAVTIALGANPGSSTLNGTLTANAVNGVAYFPGLSLNNAATGYTIVASSTGLTSATSTPISVSNVATHLVVLTQPPATVSATSPFSITVAAEDASGLIDTSYENTIMVAVGNNPGSSTLSGTTLLGANNGVITFSGLSLNNPGADYTLLVSDPTSLLQATTTTGFNVTPQPATQLVVTTQPPSGVVAGAPFSLVISAENNLNQVDTTNNDLVTLTLLNANGANLGGAPTIHFVAGIATFTGMSLSLVGTGYNLQATSGSLIPATTTSISVIPASAASFQVTPLFNSPISGVPFAVKVTAIDPFNNVVPTYSGTVHFTSSDPAFSPPTDYTFLTSDQGTHVFLVTLQTIGSQTVTVTDDANSSNTATSSPVTVIAATPTITSLMVSPLSAVLGQMVTLKATVTTDNSTGSVQFLDGSTVLATEPLTSTGASFTTTFLVGTHSLSAKYLGSTDKTLAPSSSSTVSLAVSKFTTLASVTSSTTATTLGRSVTLTAFIQPVAPGAGVPSGSVVFLDGTTILGSVILDPTGHAVLTVPKFALGTHSITFTYAGDSNGSSSKSPAINVYVGDLPKDDFDGDGKSDIAVFGFNPTLNRFGISILTSSSGFQKSVFFDNNGVGYGNSTSIPVIGDYFGDGRADYALWTPNNLGGMTFTAVSPLTGKSVIANFGGQNMVPVVADIDGDGKADFGVYGYIQGYGYCFDFIRSSDNFATSQQYIFNNNGVGYGNSTSIPIVGDFDGSGKAGFGVYTPFSSGSTFAFVDPSTNYSLFKTIPTSQGTIYDSPTAIEYDGDGKADLSLFGPDPAHPGQYRFLVLTSTTGFNPSQGTVFNNYGGGYGNGTSIPIMADYEGTGRYDFGVFTQIPGGYQYVFQTDQVGRGVIIGFPSSENLPLATSPAFLARLVRGR